MSLDWVEGRVPKPPLEDVVKAAVGVNTEGYVHQLDFYYPATGGVEALAMGMAERVRHITPGFAVRHVRRTRDGWVVSDGRHERTYARLVSTLPIVEMAEIFEDVPREVKDAVARAPLQFAIHRDGGARRPPPARLHRHLRSRPAAPVPPPLASRAASAPAMFPKAGR